jgi:hypothetical protein
VFDADLTAFLESGCATIVGLVTPSGEPFATRGWGMRVRRDGPPCVRLLVGAHALAEAGRGGDPFEIAITGGDVRTLRSVQVMGTARVVEPVTDEDRETSRRYIDDFFGDVHETDGSAVELLARLPPADLVACTVDVRDVYDQTPGPGAGGRLSGAPR